MNNPKIAVLQMKISDCVEQNIKKAIGMIDESKKLNADIAVLPEMFICPYSNESFQKNCIDINSDIFAELSACAKKNSIYIVAGSVPEIENGKIYNSSFVYDRDGLMIAKHRKIHLFDIDIPGQIKFCESDVLSAGDEVTIFDTEFGSFGLAICYDIRFPEIFKIMSQYNPIGVFIPASFNMTTGPAHWELLGRARAVDYQNYVILVASATNYDFDYKSYAHSMIINPWGEIVNKLNFDEGMFVSELNFNYVSEVRSKINLSKHRRESIYIAQKRWE